ncbi:hypothetical protein SNEBB_008179 [Seison nebaliae]|nr:hypothetical protein SNEBB_008179 [Seison nebaliae]
MILFRSPTFLLFLLLILYLFETKDASLRKRKKLKKRISSIFSKNYFHNLFRKERIDDSPIDKNSPIYQENKKIIRRLNTAKSLEEFDRFYDLLQKNNVTKTEYDEIMNEWYEEFPQIDDNRPVQQAALPTYQNIGRSMMRNVQITYSDQKEIVELPKKLVVDTFELAIQCTPQPTRVVCPTIRDIRNYMKQDKHKPDESISTMLENDKKGITILRKVFPTCIDLFECADNCACPFKTTCQPIVQQSLITIWYVMLFDPENHITSKGSVRLIFRNHTECACAKSN